LGWTKKQQSRDNSPSALKPTLIPISKGDTNESNMSCIVLLVLLYLITSVQAMLPVDDPDIWWRFRTGQWIVENHSIPLEDYFSINAMGKPWIEYSWLFELLVYVAHVLFSLSGVVYFVVGLALSITFVAHQLVRRFGLPLSAEVALVAVAMGAIKPLMTPRPWLFTIGLFSIELLIIDHVRQSRKSQLLWVLPFVFALWANLHIQFVYGLAVLSLLLLEAVLVIAFQRSGIEIEAPALAPGRLMLVLLACTTATLLTPYHYLLYKQIFEYIGQTGAFVNISELHPMFFRSPDSWLVLLLTLAAAFSLGWRRNWLPFPTLLLIMGVCLAFRARRDSWVLALAAIWVIGDSARALCHRRPFVFSKGQILASAVAVAVSLVAMSIARQISEASLRAIVEEKFPARAVNYVQANQLPGPLFNDYDWGGFLLWSLPGQPVAIDGRLNLYGDERLERSLNTWRGLPGWNSDPDLLRARLVIANKRRMLTSLLRSHPHYKIAYEDNIAVVFVAR
jgi:hypothetical protein